MVVLLLLIVACAVNAYELTLSKFNASPDGFKTQVLGVNNDMMYPIILNRGQRVNITVVNRMDEETTMHFHGIFQNGTNFYDGPVGTTQCSILPGKSLEYSFNVDHQRGTYWYHSHLKAQYSKGIRGPLIIRDLENDPYSKEYDGEYIVMLNEWYHAKNPSDLLEPCKFYHDYSIQSFVLQ
jgi:iron transport multicopper oxidase